MYGKAHIIAGCCSLAVAMSACTTNPQKRLERVAKDWSMTIRASQVMPIYPLEEDLRPGDLYLSTRTMESDIASWNQRGFLPLANRFARIEIPMSDYTAHFKNAAATSSPPTFQRLPKAAFPSYSFEVDKRGSLGLALPLGSVPVALALAGAQSATGSVVLKKATTQGLPDMLMDTRVRVWAVDNKETLQYEAKRAFQRGKPLVLRAITRVFSIGGADVSLTFEKATSFGLDAGAATTPPQLLSASKEDFDKRIAELHNSLATLKEQQEGGARPNSQVPPASRTRIPRSRAWRQSSGRLSCSRPVQRLRPRAEASNAPP